MAKGGKFGVECVSNGIISLKYHYRVNYEVFLVKNQNVFEIGKLRKYNEVVFFRKNMFSFQKHSFQKWKNGKYAGCNR